MQNSSCHRRSRRSRPVLAVRRWGLPETRRRSPQGTFGTIHPARAGTILNGDAHPEQRITRFLRCCRADDEEYISERYRHQTTATRAPMVHASVLVHPPARVPPHWRPPRPVAPRTQRLGRTAPDHHRPPQRQGPQCDGRLLRRRRQSRHPRHERLGQRRARMVAQPSSTPRSPRRPPGWPREVTARAASGDERDRLWNRWLEIHEDLNAYAALRGGETAVVVLEPRLDSAVASGQQ